MALVGQAATVAQLVGVDAYGLITMIAEAARTVRRNRATCRQLTRRVEMIGALLRRLHDTQLMHQPETRNPVEEMEETLRRAYLLVRACQRRGYAYRCFMGTRHANELREVQGEINFYLQLFPLVSYVDATLNWVRLLNKASVPSSCQEVQQPVHN
uniref:MCAfunc domain-containing protein n=1 Tax=Arundo donax TaxID=35708 RepID=A0A0A8ZHY2_ARUDO